MACFSVSRSASGPGVHPRAKVVLRLSLSSTDLPLPGQAEPFSAKPKVFLLPAQ